MWWPVTSVVEPESKLNINSFLFQEVWPKTWISPDESTSNACAVIPSIFFKENSFVVWFLIFPSYPSLTVSTVLCVLVSFVLVKATFKSPNISIAHFETRSISLPGAT